MALLARWVFEEKFNRSSNSDSLLKESGGFVRRRKPPRFPPLQILITRKQDVIGILFLP